MPIDLTPLLHFFALKGMTPWPFQLEVWEAYSCGKSGLIHVSTGSGKTLAAFGAPLADLIQYPTHGIQILYITPLKSNVNDVVKAIDELISTLKLSIRVEKRTGDLSYARKKRQTQKPPEIMLTTPESLAIMLSDTANLENFRQLKCVIVDEWHELLGNKRGVLLELSLARLAAFSTPFKLWGMSATIGNGEQSRRVLGGHHHQLQLVSTETSIISPQESAALRRRPISDNMRKVAVSTNLEREVIVETLLPDHFEELPWTGHFGIRLLPALLARVDIHCSTLLFTNTRAQAEKWFQGLQFLKPEWADRMALHHSSIDQKERERVEAGLKEGNLKLVVCTSSLDLGVDFSRVEQVVQIGSPKSIARLIQRAGRSNHRPFTPCHILIVPVQVMELLEIMAIRTSLKAQQVESRIPLELCWDVLLQHMLSYGSSGGFTKQELLKEVRSTYAYAAITQSQLDWLISFLEQGGKCLNAYPEYRKLVCEEERYQLTDPRMIRLHRLSIGTIPSSMTMQLKYVRGKNIGSIDEDFMRRLQIGDTFMFGGKAYQLALIKENVAYLKIAKRAEKVARWTGSRLPLSQLLSGSMRTVLEGFSAFKELPEFSYFSTALAIQERVSQLPKGKETLVEVTKSRKGYHLFIYPFESRVIHQTLGAILITRLTRAQKRSCTLTVNDYGCEIISNKAFEELESLFPTLFTLEGWDEDLQEAVNLKELAKGAFRDIARIAGLIIQGYPGKRKDLRQIHSTSSLLFDVFKKYDPTNLLLEQAVREVFRHEIERDHLKATFERLFHGQFLFSYTDRFSPFALPLYTESASAHASSESLEEIVLNIQKSWEKRGKL